MKKIKAILTILSILILPTGAFADMKSEVNPYGKFLAGDGVEVEMAEFAEKNSDGLYDVLLKMTGANAYKEGIDGKTVKCQAVHGGTADSQEMGRSIQGRGCGRNGRSKFPPACQPDPDQP